MCFLFLVILQFYRPLRSATCRPRPASRCPTPHPGGSNWPSVLHDGEQVPGWRAERTSGLIETSPNARSLTGPRMLLPALSRRLQLTFSLDGICRRRGVCGRMCGLPKWCRRHGNGSQCGGSIQGYSNKKDGMRIDLLFHISSIFLIKQGLNGSILKHPSWL